MSSPKKTNSDWKPWVAPFALLLALTFLPLEAIGVPLLWRYPIRMFGVAVALWYWWRRRSEDHPTASRSWCLLPAGAVGLLVLVVWIGLEGWYPLLGEDQTVDPRMHLAGVSLWGWIVVRIIGSATIVAAAEEIFWRGFLYRWITRSDFLNVSPRALNLSALLVVAVLFAVEHNRWLPGLIAGLAYTLLYVRTGSLRATVLAHGTTNLLLGCYIAMTGSWQYW